MWPMKQLEETPKSVGKPIEKKITITRMESVRAPRRNNISQMTLTNVSELEFNNSLQDLSEKEQNRRKHLYRGLGKERYH
jgi:hypothetical protein